MNASTKFDGNEFALINEKEIPPRQRGQPRWLALFLAIPLGKAWEINGADALRLGVKEINTIYQYIWNYKADGRLPKNFRTTIQKVEGVRTLYIINHKEASG